MVRLELRDQMYSYGVEDTPPQLVYGIFGVLRLELRDQMYSYGVEDTPLNWYTVYLLW